MSYQERKSITNIVSTIIITTIYALIMYQKYSAGSLDDSNLFKLWAIIILIFIPISVVARIIILIIYHILESIVQVAQGNDPEESMDVMDERDKLIEMKSTAISMYIFSLSFVIALITQLFDVSGHVFFITLIIGGFLSDMVSELLKIRFYRRGV